MVALFTTMHFSKDQDISGFPIGKEWFLGFLTFNWPTPPTVLVLLLMRSKKNRLHPPPLFRDMSSPLFSDLPANIHQNTRIFPHLATRPGGWKLETSLFLCFFFVGLLPSGVSIVNHLCPCPPCPLSHYLQSCPPLHRQTCSAPLLLLFMILFIIPRENLRTCEKKTFWKISRGKQGKTWKLFKDIFLICLIFSVVFIFFLDNSRRQTAA